MPAHHSPSPFPNIARPRKSAKYHVFFPGFLYCEALRLAHIESIRDHQNHFTKNLFQSVVTDPSNNTDTLKYRISLKERKEVFPTIIPKKKKKKRFEESFVNRCVS